MGIIEEIHWKLYLLGQSILNFLHNDHNLVLIIAAVLIPIITIFILFFSAMDDFWQIIHLKISFGRLFGDLFHFLLILFLGSVAELAVLYFLLVPLF